MDGSGFHSAEEASISAYAILHRGEVKGGGGRKRVETHRLREWERVGRRRERESSSLQA